MRFEKIIIVGANTVACDCIRTACGIVSRDMVSAIETASDSFSMLEKICHKYSVRYERFTDSKAITMRLDEETDGMETLIISANNRYIFKAPLIEKENVEIINFHYALLPGYRGINIPSWVIYNGEKETGVTWHYVVEQVDHGKIIAQEKIPIDGRTTAFDITREGMRLATVLFQSFFGKLIESHIEGIDIAYPLDSKPYLSKDRPNDGRISISDSIGLIDRMLRAYDYHGIPMLGDLFFFDGDKEHIVESYSIQKCEGFFGSRIVERLGGGILIAENSKKICIHYKEERNNAG